MPFLSQVLRIGRCIALFFSAASFGVSAFQDARGYAAIFALASGTQFTAAILCTTFACASLSRSCTPRTRAIDKAAIAVYCCLDLGFGNLAFCLWRVISSGWAGFMVFISVLIDHALRPLLNFIRRPIVAVWASPWFGLFFSVFALGVSVVLQRNGNLLSTYFSHLRSLTIPACIFAARMHLAVKAAVDASNVARLTYTTFQALTSLDAVLLRGLHSSPAFAATLCIIHAGQAAALRICARNKMPASRNAIAAFMARSASSAAIAPIIVLQLGALFRVSTLKLRFMSLLTWALGSVAVAVEGYERTSQNAMRANLQAARDARRHQTPDIGDVLDPCAICLDELAGASNLAELPCGHEFHGPCIREWLCKEARCPFCRCHITLPLPCLSEEDEDDGTHDYAVRHGKEARQQPSRSSGSAELGFFLLALLLF